MASLAVLMVLSVDCVEYGTAVPGISSDTTPRPGPTAISRPRDALMPVERCNGLDDDMDGEVDEGFPDVDRDSIADCVDSECDVAEGEPLIVRPHSCEVALTPPAADPWDVAVCWERNDIPSGCRVGAVADLDSDGVAEVLCSGEELHVLNGTTGATSWTFSGFDTYSPIVVADINNDGAWNIVGLNREGHALALSATGAELWVSDVVVGPAGGTLTHFTNLVVADLEGDGTAEIVGLKAILRGLDGALVAPLYDDHEREIKGPPHELVVIDLDLDGRQEVLLKGMIFEADGTLRHSMAEDTTIWRSSVPVPVQADEDEEPEIAWLFDEEFQVIDGDGTVLAARTTPIPHQSWSLACAADIDSDGRPEFLHSDREYLRAWDLDGLELWRRESTDTTTCTGCTTFDFDANGTSEIAFSDELGFYIIDGATGDTLFEDRERYSLTIGETPLIVDLDGDGSVEVVLGGFQTDDGYSPSVSVYCKPDRDWPSGRTIWPWEAWSGDGLFTDGSVPTHPGLSWLTDTRWRSQPVVFSEGVDLAPHVAGACASSCAGSMVTLSVQLANSGMVASAPDQPLTVYDADPDDGGTPLTVVEFRDAVPAGSSSAVIELQIGLDLARSGLVFVAGEGGDGVPAGIDCEPGNDQLQWRFEDCD